MEESPLGKIQVAPQAIASIVSDAVLSCYGVVGMSASTLKDGIAEILQVGNTRRGVKVEVTEGKIAIDLFVVVQFGTRISEVAQNVMESVKFGVEQSVGMDVAHVNVHVQGLRVSNED